MSELLTFWFCTFLCETMNYLAITAYFKVTKSSSASVIIVMVAFFSCIAEWLCKLTITVAYMKELQKCNKHQSMRKFGEKQKISLGT